MRFRALLLFSVIAATTHAALAQSTTGQITGRVTDPSDAVIVGPT